MTQNNKIALITGATSGIGSIILDHLAKTDHQLLILARSEDKLKNHIKKIQQINPNVKTEGFICDLSSFESIQKTCAKIKATYQQIDLLVLNAGIWNFEYKESKDQIEETFQVNLLAPIMLFEELKTLLLKNDVSKVIITASALHQGEIHFNDLELREEFSGFKAYRQSKLGVILMTRWLAENDAYTGISFYAVHPGMVNTELGRSAGWFSRTVFKLFGKSPEKGAETHNYIIDQANSNLKSGEYYANKKITKTATYTYNMSVAKKLWNAIQTYLKINTQNHAQNP
jgi:NAD(P)-dependent dehydrogenase (short-subunit alcohol dehydrogenase family)